MSAIITMRITVPKDKAKEFLDLISWEHIVITDIHNDPEGWEVFTQPEQMGYNEPVELYEKLKDCVKDIHSLVIGDGILVEGCDTTGYVWESSKKRFEEDYEIETTTLNNNKEVKDFFKKLNEVK